MEGIHRALMQINTRWKLDCFKSIPKLLLINTVHEDLVETLSVLLAPYEENPPLTGGLP